VTRVRWERVDRSLRARLGDVELQVTHDVLGWHAFASRKRAGGLEIVAVNMLASERAAKRRARQEARRLGGG
jgi:hypothetical protein